MSKVCYVYVANLSPEVKFMLIWLAEKFPATWRGNLNPLSREEASLSFIPGMGDLFSQKSFEARVLTLQSKEFTQGDVCITPMPAITANIQHIVYVCTIYTTQTSCVSEIGLSDG